MRLASVPMSGPAPQSSQERHRRDRARTLELSSERTALLGLIILIFIQKGHRKRLHEDFPASSGAGAARCEVNGPLQNRCGQYPNGPAFVNRFSRIAGVTPSRGLPGNRA